MKSTEKNREFTLEDFEKGLMLAGFISPKNEQEILEREILAEHDKQVSDSNKKTYFKRVVLAAKIVDELIEEKTFGRVKFQKLIYLCEHSCEMGLNNRYAKFAAGPFDHKFMHSINKEFKKQKWYDVGFRKDAKYKVPVYSKMEKYDSYKQYYNRYFSDTHESIQTLIDIFKNVRTRQVELVATIYACLLELKESDTIINIETLSHKLYSWSKEKAKFSRDEIGTTYDWMIKQQIVPNRNQ